MTAPTVFQILTDQFWLSAERVIYWEQEAALLVSDLHFGKTGHFRKNGINVPAAVYKEDLQRFIHLIAFFKPKKIIAVGDLFHSKANQEIDQFAAMRADFPELEFLLVKGNHDILSDELYAQLHIQTHHEKLSIGHFDFVHDAAMIDKLDKVDDAVMKNKSNLMHDAGMMEQFSNQQRFCFTGHLHPAVRIKGAGKQQLQFPCFILQSGWAFFLHLVNLAERPWYKRKRTTLFLQSSIRV